MFCLIIRIIAKEVTVLAVSPVNGYGLFQYLGVFFENGISYRVFAVTGSEEIKTSSGIVLTVDGVVASLKGHEDGYDALVFVCGDTAPVFRQNAGKSYNITMLKVIKAFDGRDKVMIGHCAAAMILDFTGITKGKKVTVHPLARPTTRNEEATNNSSETDGDFYATQDEDNVQTMIRKIMAALRA